MLKSNLELLEYVRKRRKEKKEGEEEKKRKPIPIYDRFLFKEFPEKRRMLPIVAAGYCYTMDIMFMHGPDVENLSDGKGNRVVAEYEYESDYNCALVIVETTSRKAWAYPMKSKKSGEVLRKFLQFYHYDINGKISRLISDSGKEYSGVKKWNDLFKRSVEPDNPDNPDKINGKFHYYQVNASQNHHTALSRVDRFIRTLRGLIKDVLDGYPDDDWAEDLPIIVDFYNNRKHHSLKHGYWQFKRFYTPDEVYNNPELRRRQQILDFTKKYKGIRMYKNYKWYRDNYTPGKMVKYRIMVKGFRKDHPRGFISQYPAIIKGREGNSFFIQMKTLIDVKRDNEFGRSYFFSGPVVLVPASDLVLYKGDPVEKRLSEEEQAFYKLLEDLRYDQRHDYNTMDYDMKSLLKRVMYIPEVVVPVKVPIVKRERKPAKKTKKKMEIYAEHHINQKIKRHKQQQKEDAIIVKKLLKAEPESEPSTRKKNRINPEVTGENLLPPDAKRQRKAPKRYDE